MKDIFGIEVQVGDTIILPVSRRSHYLTSAQIESKAEDIIMARYTSTPATKNIKPGDKFIKVSHKLPSGLEMYDGCLDCVGQRLNTGDTVAYRSKSGISISRIKEIEGDLEVSLEDGNRVRNVGTYKINEL